MQALVRLSVKMKLLRWDKTEKNMLEQDLMRINEIYWTILIPVVPFR